MPRHQGTYKETCTLRFRPCFDCPDITTNDAYSSGHARKLVWIVKGTCSPCQGSCLDSSNHVQTSVNKVDHVRTSVNKSLPSPLTCSNIIKNMYSLKSLMSRKHCPCPDFYWSTCLLKEILTIFYASLSTQPPMFK